MDNFTGTPIGKLGILNNYIPNCSQSREACYGKISHGLDFGRGLEHDRAVL
jgi:hypothetical protein